MRSPLNCSGIGAVAAHSWDGIVLPPLYLVYGYLKSEFEVLMQVDRKKFVGVINALLKSPPVPRAEAKTGQPKTGKIIAPKPTR